MRVPNLTLIDNPTPAAPMIAEAAERWRASRVDCADAAALVTKWVLGARVLGRLVHYGLRCLDAPFAKEVRG